MSRNLLVRPNLDSKDISFENLVVEHPECGRPLIKKRNPATGRYSLSCSVCGVDLSFDDAVLVALNKVAVSQKPLSISITVGAIEETIQLLPERD